MALNLKALGKPLGPVTKDYGWKDAVLYALGVGAGFNEIEYTYEKNLKVLPSFAIAAVFDFFPLFCTEANVNLAGILHGEQQIVFRGEVVVDGARQHADGFGDVAHARRLVALTGKKLRRRPDQRFVSAVRPLGFHGSEHTIT